MFILFFLLFLLICRLWERAAVVVGHDFVSHTFWDKYVDFEVSRESYARATALYYRVLQTPLEQLSNFFEKFKVYANTRFLVELLLPEEAAELEERKKVHEAKYFALTQKKEEGEAIDSSEITAAGIKTGDEVEVEYRVKVMANREEMYKKVRLLSPFFPIHSLTFYVMLDIGRSKQATHF